MTTITDTAELLHEAHRQGMNEGRAEGIEAFFSALEIALAHHSTIEGIRHWRDAAYAAWKAAQ